MLLALAAALLAAPTSAAPAAAVSDPTEGGGGPVIRLTPGGMFNLADEARTKGDVATASAVYRALEGNPDETIRAEAMFRHARLLIELGKKRDAALLLRRLIDEQPKAAPPRLELARLLQELGDSGMALRELRAAQATGLPPEVARLVDRYSQAIRASRAAGASLEIALAPDSNINHATRLERIGTVIGDFSIDPESKAKSGTGLALRGQVFRRFPLGSNARGLVTISGLADLYRASRFNDIAADVSAGPELAFGRSRVNLAIGATQRWYGQKPFMRSARIEGSWTRPVGTRTQVRLSASAALVDNLLNDLADGRNLSARIEAEHALSGTTGLGVTLTGGREALKDPGYSTRSWRLGLLGWRDLGRMTLTAEVGLGRLAADRRLLLFPAKRSERFTSAAIGATFRQVQFAGFSPVVRLRWERNRSSIAFYDFRRLRSEFGIARAF